MLSNKVKTEGQENWLVSISADPKLPCSFCLPDVNCYTSIDLDLIHEAQNRDPRISRIIARTLTTKDWEGESPQVKDP